MSSAIILSLSSELIQAIGAELSLVDVKSFRLTCRVMAESLSGRIFHTLSLEVRRHNMINGVEKLETLAAANHIACFATRMLSIGLLSPIYDPPTTVFREGKWVTPDPASEAAFAEEKMLQHLFGALTALKGVYSVTWKASETSNLTTHRIVMDALKLLPNLRRLHISILGAKIPLELDALRSLEEIIISTEQTKQPHQDEILENLATAIAHNSGLTYIDVTGICYYGSPNANKLQSLHQLFKYYPATAPPLRLRTLKLKSFLLRLDDLTLPHLANLTSLTLVGIDNPFRTPSIRHSRRAVPLPDSMIKERKRYGSSTEDIWKVIQKAGIHLEKITIDEIPSSFLNYLSSYSGLIHLDLTPGGFDNGGTSDAMAVRFFEGPLENHVQCLESLQIRPHFEGLWCFGTHNIEFISTLTKLKHFSVTIRGSDLSTPGKGPDQASLRPDIIKTLLDMTLEHMPDIESVHVQSASLESERGAWCGTGMASYFQHVYRKMVESVKGYTALPSFQRVPSLQVCLMAKFTGERRNSALGEQDHKSGVDEPSWVYVCSTPRGSSGLYF